MTIWKNSRGLQMILHQENKSDPHAGAHAYSTDNGVSWTVSGNAYTLTVNTSKGLLSYGRRERPQFLKPASAKGQPTHMFNGVADMHTGFTHTIAVPLA